MVGTYESQEEDCGDADESLEGMWDHRALVPLMSRLNKGHEGIIPQPLREAETITTRGGNNYYVKRKQLLRKVETIITRGGNNYYERLKQLLREEETIITRDGNNYYVKRKQWLREVETIIKGGGNNHGRRKQSREVETITGGGNNYKEAETISGRRKQLRNEEQF